MDPGGTGIPVFELRVVGETGQGQEEAQLAVVLLGRAELLQAVEALDGLLHRQLQLGSMKGLEVEVRGRLELKVQEPRGAQLRTF